MKLRVLRELADLVSRGHQPDEIYRTAVDAVLVAASADRASILTFDESGVMRFRAWHRLSDGYRAAVEGHSPWRADERDPMPVLVPDALADSSLTAFRELFLGEGIRALAFIPLVHQERLLGKFMLYYDRPHDFSEDELDAAGTVATQVSFALDRARAQSAIEDLLGRERTARAAAEAANRAKDEFLAMLAHELRNPLSAIVNAVGILERTGGQDATPALARTLVRRQTDHLARLLDDLLDMTRINRGLIDLRTENLDFRTVVLLAVEAQRHRIDAKQQNLTLALPDTPVAVIGDPARLQQVVGNLVSNASKYTSPHGSITLSLTFEQGGAVLRVRDSGVGIPPDRLGSIFDLYTQLNPNLVDTDGGLGIGLTLVKRLVELHGGTVQAHSEGRHTGAVFSVRLPVAVAPSSAPPAPSRSSALPKRFVLIEDNDDAREALLIALQIDGHEVHGARTAGEGLELVPRAMPDVVLIDIGLPDLDGYEVARRLRAKLGATVRLVALTGYGQPEDRKRSLDAGFDDHLVKPVAAEDVTRLLAAGS